MTIINIIFYRSSIANGFFRSGIPTKFSQRGRPADPVYIPYNWDYTDTDIMSTTSSSSDDNKKKRRRRRRGEMYTVHDDSYGMLRIQVLDYTRFFFANQIGHVIEVG